jgi:hypothetical protein
MGKTPYREGPILFLFWTRHASPPLPLGLLVRAHHWAAGCSNSWRFAGGLPALSDRRLGAGLVLARQVVGAGLFASEPVNDIVRIATDGRWD